MKINYLLLEYEKTSTTESRINRSNQQNNATTTITRTKSSNLVVASVPSRSNVSYLFIMFLLWMNFFSILNRQI